MADAKKCDRCGKLYEHKRIYPFPQIQVVDAFSDNNQRACMDLSILDLCFECEQSFFDWLGKNKIKERK